MLLVIVDDVVELDDVDVAILVVDIDVIVVLLEVDFVVEMDVDVDVVGVMVEVDRVGGGTVTVDLVGIDDCVVVVVRGLVVVEVVGTIRVMVDVSVPPRVTPPVGYVKPGILKSVGKPIPISMGAPRMDVFAIEKQPRSSREVRCTIARGFNVESI